MLVAVHVTLVLCVLHDWNDIYVACSLMRYECPSPSSGIVDHNTNIYNTWYSIDGHGPGTYSSEQQALMLHCLH